MKTVELYARVRHAVQIQGMSRRAAAEQFGIDPRTVAKMLKFSVPPGYVRTKPPFRPKLDAFTGVIDAILAADKYRPKKQRHTSKRIFERLRDEHGFTGGVTIVKDYTSGWRQRAREMFVPLVHPPGHAQADFGEALAKIDGALRKIHFLAIHLPHSDAIFVVAYPAETTKAFCDGHVKAFAFSAVCRNRSSTTTPGSRWLVFSVMAAVSARVCSANCNRITCSRTGLAARGKATTRVRSRGWSATRGATFWCRSRRSRVSMR
jgi:transposase